MTEMIEAEPDLAVRLIEAAAAEDAPGADAPVARLAAAVREALERHGTVIATGCGTSEHGAMAIVEQLIEAAAAAGLDRSGIRSEQALELTFDPPASGLVIGVSHEGGTWATNLALERARGAGARTALVTAAAASPGAGCADSALVVATGEVDQSWCHTVAYLSALVVGALVAVRVARKPLPAPAVRALLAGPLAEPASIEQVADRLAAVERLIVVASGADRAAGRELVLKVEEGAALPAAYRDLETFLHGHLAGVDERTGLVLILTDRRSQDARSERSRQLLAAAHVLGMPVAAIVSAAAVDRIPHELMPAGRIVVPDGVDLPASTAALLATTVPLQLLTERLARARGHNPDAIRRDDERYRAAAGAAE
jgi:glutamine---fructose-6-phosphate transaminase (isomerizing)